MNQTNEQVLCPVMKSSVRKELSEKMGWVREYKGKTYYFCCAGCPEQFDKDPEKYLKENASSDHSGHSEHGHMCC